MSSVCFSSRQFYRCGFDCIMVSIWLLHPLCAMYHVDAVPRASTDMQLVGLLLHGSDLNSKSHFSTQLVFDGIRATLHCTEWMEDEGWHSERCAVTATSVRPRLWAMLIHSRQARGSEGVPRGAWVQTYTHSNSFSLRTWLHHTPKPGNLSFIFLQCKIRNSTICEYHMEAMPCAGTSKHAGASGKQTNRGCIQCSTFQLSRTFQPKLIRT